jgi:hypothetical protein
MQDTGKVHSDLLESQITPKENVKDRDDVPPALLAKHKAPASQVINAPGSTCVTVTTQIKWEILPQILENEGD